MTKLALLIITEAAHAMRTVLARGKQPAAKDLIAAALAELRESDSPMARQHIGPTSKIHATLEQVALCAMGGKRYVELYPAEARKLDPSALESIEAALAKPAAASKAKAAGRKRSLRDA